MLPDLIDHWLEHGPKEGDDIRLITGGPGSGKSTFAKWLGADLSDRNRMKVLFFPLQRFRITAGLKDAIGAYLRGTERFQSNPVAQEGFASAGSPLLLIFDGLDELTKPGDLADEQTRVFIEELQHNLGLWNDNGVRVLALITGRTVYAQAKRSLLRIRDRQEIAVLPYLLDDAKKNELERHESINGEQLLDDDQRLSWWEKYAEAKGLGKTSPPDIFINNKDLRELTAEPLLNYVVVLSGFHQEVGAGAGVNRNLIYARLLKDVIDRRHAKRANADDPALGAVRDVDDREKFERLLETIALSALYGDGRTTTAADIEKLLQSDLQKTWLDLTTGGPGFTRLIAAFYIRNVEGSSDTNAIEFTHKSFGEFMTARRLVREIERIDLGRRVSSQFYTEDAALSEWARLTSAKAMTMDLLRFIRDEVALRSKQTIEQWQDTLTALFSRELTEGFLLAALGKGESFRSIEVRSRNAEEALLVVLNACARAVQRITRPD